MSQQQYDGYIPPPWARPPPAPSSSREEWRLLEIKAGVQVGEHSLTDRPCTVLGRAEDAVDAALLHPSCSRQHARIAFDAGGRAWLRDLGSAHGTTVNKKPLPPGACGRTESDSTTTRPGARGVVLFPGDVIRFGASTRLFCVEGPSDQSRAAAAVAKAQAKMSGITSTSTGAGAAARLLQSSDTDESSASSSSGRPPQEKDEGVSWGISMDDDVGVDNDADRETSGGGMRSSSASTALDALDDDKIPDQHRKEWEKIKALQYKLGNLQTESERIQRKGAGDDLTEGQQRQLDRNRERSTALENDIGTRQEVLWKKLHPEASGLSANGKRQRRQASKDRRSFYEEDEVDDRTSGRQQSLLDDDGETEQSLKRKYRAQHERLATLCRAADRAEEEAEKLQQRAALLDAVGDDDAYFAKNEADLANEGVRKLAEERNQIAAAMSELERLLRVANPKLTVDPETGYIGVGPPLPPPSSTTRTSLGHEGKSETSLLPPPPPPRTSNTANWGTAESTGDDGAFVMPAPRLPVGAGASKVARPAMEEEDGSSSSSLLPPPPTKRKRVLGPAMPPPPGIEAPPPQQDASASPSTTRKKQESLPATARGTLAILTATNSSSTTHATVGSSGGTHHSAKTKEVRSEGGGARIKNSSTKPPAADGSDPREDVWHAPKDQDGSGRTKLNEKFGGRY